ncbi:hypothetical protein NMG60_11019539 [Bertholletia excelsa]
MMRQGGTVGSTRCQDCGNHAKKDCAYVRCRTCCKSRGFHCQTHVKSTWIPVSKRRPKQEQLIPHHQQQQFSTATVPQQEQEAPNPKRFRDSLSSGFEEGDFPAELQIPATFRCVRVSSQDNVVDQYAYQTAVSIGGRLFKGILYDQGPAHQSHGESSSAVMVLQHGVVPPACPASPSTYPADPLNAFLPGTPYFPYPKS